MVDSGKAPQDGSVVQEVLKRGSAGRSAVLRQPGLRQPGLRQPGLRQPGLRQPGLRQPVLRRGASRVLLGGLLVAGMSFAYLGCARTDLDPADMDLGESREPNTVVDAGPDAPLDAEDADVEDVPVVDADVEDVPLMDVDVEDVVNDVPCEPSEEVCNGVDDDCDGDVDEVPPVECSDGGFSYCIAGAMSECPRQCETCMPGSETICFVTYCYFWGVQTCAADGKSLSGCKEEPPPAACRAIAQKHQKSRQLEQCCIDEGFCCKDDFDLDKDGDTSDYVGTCSEVLCGDD